MKLDRIPTRRQPVKKKVYARLFNKTRPKRQRASAAAASPEDMEGAGINISRSLSIIFAIHILAIGMIFIHKQYLSGRTTAPVSNAQKGQIDSSDQTAKPKSPVLSDGTKPYMAKQGESYATIATHFGVDEKELLELNRGAELRSGVVLRIPQKKRIVAGEPAEVAALRNQQNSNSSEDGLVEILPQTKGPESQLILPSRTDSENIPKATPVSSAQTHKVKAGESIWRISNQYNVGQKELMSLNKITDPTKLRVGQVLKLP
jgi:LysM repeat protein